MRPEQANAKSFEVRTKKMAMKYIYTVVYYLFFLVEDLNIRLLVFRLLTPS
jgi:hypothetical protein